MLCELINLFKKYRRVKLIHNISNLELNQHIVEFINDDHIHIESYLAEDDIIFNIKFNGTNIPILRKCSLQSEIVSIDKLPVDISKISKILGNQMFVNVLWCGSLYPKLDDYIHFEFSSNQPYVVYIFSKDVTQLTIDNNRISNSIKMDTNLDQILVVFIPLIKEGIKLVKDRNKKIFCIIHFCEYIDQDISKEIIKNISKKLDTFHQNLTHDEFVKSSPLMIKSKK